MCKSFEDFCLQTVVWLCFCKSVFVRTVMFCKISNHWVNTVNKYIRQLRMSCNFLGESKNGNIEKEVMKWKESQCRKRMKKDSRNV